MEKYFWDAQLNYLKSTRAQMWNDDYFEFLVNKVWQFHCPKNIIDFGCGYGYLGTKLLPLLPDGSTYTGIDMGEELLVEARKLFKNTPFHTEFINMDLREYVAEKQYDIAICQAVLRHIPQSRIILKKMVDSVVPSGEVICIEVNRKMENAGLYIHNCMYDSKGKDSALQKQWDNELQNNGRDYMLGIKIPIYMEQLGLKNVGIRVNDFVEFISPKHDGERYKEHAKTFLSLNNLQDIGNDANSLSFIHARSLLISYGTK
ncbi:MAG TPA: methyltransferase domain-containing protein [Caproicibacter sp.]|nr:methyltransferase domain-containing protein [Caproicibacter sp.]